jgi:hypothetical protein
LSLNRGIGWATIFMIVFYTVTAAVLYLLFRYGPLAIQWIALTFARIVS